MSQNVSTVKNNWQIAYNEYVDFINKNGKMPQAQNSKKEKKLAEWANRQRTAKRKNKLKEDQLDLLERIIGWSWEFFQNAWDIKLEKLKVYVNQYQALPTANGNKETKKLFNWVNSQRRKKKEGKLDVKKIRSLESVKFWVWDVFESKWENKYNELVDFVNINKRMPRTFSGSVYLTFKQEHNLSLWVQTQKKNFINKSLSKDKINKLENVNGWKW